MLDHIESEELSPEERAAAWAEYENERVTGYTTLQQQQQQAAQQQMLLKQAAQQQAAAAKQQALLKRQQEQQAKKMQQKMSRNSVFPSTRYVSLWIREFLTKIKNLVLQVHLLKIQRMQSLN